MSDYKLVILGTSSGYPQSDRATSGTLINCAGDLSLIDVGSGVISAFLKLENDPQNLNRVFITHTHPDHICELPLLIQLLHLSGKTTPFDLYLPEEFVEPFQNMMTSMYMFPEKFEFEFNIIGYNDGFLFTDPFSLTAISNDHLLGYEDIIKDGGYKNEMKSNSFLLNINGKKILYSGDVSNSRELQSFMKGCDYIIMDTTHSSLDELINITIEDEVGKFILTHLGDADTVKQMRRRITEEELKSFVLAHERMILFL
ncbi:MAG: hypothetical protein DRP35_00370 [Candidatus Zixiibacteriota bacterium]|nr:MAG: hypothetical protein DRP35_00370 [candidate division Zixibacteria bacterium]